MGGVLSTDGSASDIPCEGGAWCVFFRCTLLRLYTVPSVSSTSYDQSSSRSTAVAFFHDLSPSLNGFILIVSPSCNVGILRITCLSTSIDPFLVSLRKIVIPVSL